MHPLAHPITEQEVQPARQRPERVATPPPTPVVTQRQQVQRPVSYHQQQRNRLGFWAYWSYRLESMALNRTVLVRQPPRYTHSMQQQRPAVLGRVTITEEETLSEEDEEPQYLDEQEEVEEEDDEIIWGYSDNEEVEQEIEDEEDGDTGVRHLYDRW